MSNPKYIIYICILDYSIQNYETIALNLKSKGWGGCTSDRGTGKRQRCDAVKRKMEKIREWTRKKGKVKTLQILGVDQTKSVYIKQLPSPRPKILEMDPFIKTFFLPCTGCCYAYHENSWYTPHNLRNSHFAFQENWYRLDNP